MTVTEQARTLPAKAYEDIVHICCCDESGARLALCGHDLSTSERTDAQDPECVPCAIAERRGEPCPKYGRCIEDPGVQS